MSALLFMYLKFQMSLMASFGLMFTMAMRQMEADFGGEIGPKPIPIEPEEALPAEPKKEVPEKKEGEAEPTQKEK